MNDNFLESWGVNGTIDHLYPFWALFSNEDNTNMCDLLKLTVGYKYIFMNIFKKALKSFCIKKVHCSTPHSGHIPVSKECILSLTGESAI